MLSFQEKLAIIESFPELQRKDVSLGRINFQYNDSIYDKKNVVYHLHPNGNGFVYGGHLHGEETDDKGMINIREYSADALHSLIQASIRSLSPKTAKEQAITGNAPEERWKGPDKQTLLLIHEDDLWYVYSGLNMEMAFETRAEAVQYLHEEGFSRI
ncbi:hypothetical protein [Paenibacillus thalictri]|uniref:Uncharacterized protein n=1 Tax=Paenibacillus thalictri TaxID=2527873 RepID=A0A4Q9DI15_9BACL|nr:hypothetical protein [Paenibacillus thalictri]TBL72698.1 hypothetical protein EYB31_28540 [Paenibacillus thalictri]